MESIDIRLALKELGTGWQFGGSVTEGTEKSWDAVIWEDTRDKPSWKVLQSVSAAAVNNELLANLRIKRNARLSETDMYLLLDYPISEDDLILVKKYRSALRDITNLDGAPWDGGGSETPWPEKPIIKPIDN